MWADPVDKIPANLKESLKKMTPEDALISLDTNFPKDSCKKNGLLSVIRAHEAQANGFKMYHWGGTKQFPTVITIFPAPNYCDFYNNKGAVIKFKVFLILSQNNTLDIQQFL